MNDEIITTREVLRRAIIINASESAALQSIIEDKVITRQAIKEEINISDAEMGKAMAERIAHFDSPENFTKTILNPLGMDMEEYRNETKEQIMRDKYFQTKIGAIKLSSGSNINFIIDTGGKLLPDNNS